MHQGHARRRDGRLAGRDEAEENTRKGYATHARLYIKPALGKVPLNKINAQVLEELYAQLRRCRIRCNGKVPIDHRAAGEHECRVVRHRRPPGRRPANWETEHDCKAAGCVVEECPPHECKPLSASTVRQVHIAIPQRCIVRGTSTPECPGKTPMVRSREERSFLPPPAGHRRGTPPHTPGTTTSSRRQRSPHESPDYG